MKCVVNFSYDAGVIVHVHQKNCGNDRSVIFYSIKSAE